MSFETFLTHDKSRPKRGRRITTVMSLLLHGAGLCFAVAYSFWHVDALSAPAQTITFATGMAPPPPPPPPKGSTQKRRRRVSEVAQPRPKDAVVQPKDTPRPDDERPGVPDGDDHGVPDGVV